MTVETMEENSGGILVLMARHSCKRMPEEPVPVGHCLIAVAIETEDTQDTREPADPAPVDEEGELEGTDNSLEFKALASNVTQKHF
ncbi:uncharacterized [Tachysurus ichikawai]